MGKSAAAPVQAVPPFGDNAVGMKWKLRAGYSIGV